MALASEPAFPGSAFAWARTAGGSRRPRNKQETAARPDSASRIFIIDVPQERRETAPADIFTRRHKPFHHTAFAGRTFQRNRRYRRNCDCDTFRVGHAAGTP